MAGRSDCTGSPLQFAALLSRRVFFTHGDQTERTGSNSACASMKLSKLNRLEALFAAIILNNIAAVGALLATDDTLVTLGSKRDALDLTINHWIYAGDSPLHVAAAGYRVEIASILLAAGADCCSAGNRRRSQPIHYASDGSLSSSNWDAKRQVDMIRLLLRAGADIDAQDLNGASPLHRAVRTRCASAVSCLLEAGTNPRIRNRPGSTAFHLAVQNTGRGGSGATAALEGQRAILLSFLEHGVSPTLEDAGGKSVLDWAKSEWIREILAKGAV